MVYYLLTPLFDYPLTNIYFNFSYVELEVMSVMQQRHCFGKLEKVSHLY